MKNNRVLYLLAGAWSLLLIPFIAMFFTSEVRWDETDFIVMGILLSCVALTVEFVLRKVRGKRSRIFLIAAAFFLFVLVWAELAVGIFGTPFAGS